MKDLRISTELASAVLGKEVTKCSLINKTRNSINITYFEDKEDFNTICREWNIYELSYKIIEMLENKGFWISVVHKGLFELIFKSQEVTYIYSENIFSASFELGEWVLKKTGN